MSNTEENLCEKIGVWTEEKERIYKNLMRRVEEALEGKTEGMDEESEEYKELFHDAMQNAIREYEEERIKEIEEKHKGGGEE